ncbi:MAG TPA: hypothetical protein V6C57_12535 [Coleofasciculaceae cyanobacterium]
MDVETFESRTRDMIEEALNRLQTAALLAAQLETEIAQTGQTVQNLSHLIETFLEEQRRQNAQNPKSR